MTKVTFSHGPKQGVTEDVAPREADRLIRAGAAVVSDTTPEPEPEPVVEPAPEPEKVTEPKPRKNNKEANNG